MPTRRATDPATFHQSRFASSKGVEKGLRCNLVAKRAALLNDPQDRAMVYFLQQASHQEGGLEALFQRADVLAEQSRTAGTDGMEGRLADAIRTHVIEEASILCLDPESRPDLFPYRDKILHLMQSQRAEAAQSIARTSLAAQIWDDLEFCLSSRSLVLIEGRERIGKTATANAFAAAHPGGCVLVSLEAGDDDASFFRAFARAVGTSCTAQRKASEIRARVEDALKEGHLMLVIDEAHFLWPQRQRIRSAPHRIDWLRTSIIDAGVPVALLSTPQFHQKCQQCEGVTGWNSAQIKGRVSLHRKLEQSLSPADIQDIIAFHLPELSRVEAAGVAAMVLEGEGYAATVQRLRLRAQYLAKKAGRGAISGVDIREALAETAPLVRSPARQTETPGKRTLVDKGAASRSGFFAASVMQH